MFPTLVTEFLLNSLDDDVLSVCEEVCREWYVIGQRRSVSNDIANIFWQLIFQCGDLDIMKFAVTTNFLIPHYDHFINSISGSAPLAIVEWLYERLNDDEKMILEKYSLGYVICSCVRRGNIDLLHWMSSSKFHVNMRDYIEHSRSTDLIIHWCLQSGNLDIVKWIKQYTDDSRYYKLVIVHLIEDGDFNLISWVLKNFSFSTLINPRTPISLYTKNRVLSKVQRLGHPELVQKVSDFIQIE